MSTAIRSLGILLVATVSGCAAPTPTYIRYVSNTGATQQKFMQDRNACYEETRAIFSAAVANKYGGAAASQVIPPCRDFNACLAARGYARSDTSNLADFNQPGSLVIPPGDALQCSD
jgi:hypothetical protein